MKDYEKAAIAIGAAALGLAAYQALKTKEAVDSTKATDAAKTPIKAAVDLSKNVVGSVTSWFNQRYDNATGKVKGKSEDVITSITAVPQSISYNIKRVVDYGRDATESGTKYVYNIFSRTASSGKEKISQLTNKPFTLMGSLVGILDVSRPSPKSGESLENVKTGVGSKTEVTEKSNRFRSSLQNFRNYFMPGVK